MKRVPSTLSAAIFTSALLASPLAAQMSQEVKFAPGNYGTTLSGEVRGHDYSDFKVGAGAGQEMFVELAVARGKGDGDGTIYFNILPPGSDGEAIYNGSQDGNTAQIDLEESGDYTVRVYLMGNDRDTDKTVGFNLDFSIQ